MFEQRGERGIALIKYKLKSRGWLQKIVKGPKIDLRIRASKNILSYTVSVHAQDPDHVWPSKGKKATVYVSQIDTVQHALIYTLRPPPECPVASLNTVVQNKAAASSGGSTIFFYITHTHIHTHWHTHTHTWKNQFKELSLSYIHINACNQRIHSRSSPVSGTVRINC